jgi:conjugative transfer region lipoprotein (TIGR03751 family)
MRSHLSTDLGVRRAITALLAVSAVAGCATNKEKLLPHGELTMSQLWERETGRAGERQLLDARAALRRPLVDDPPVRLSQNATYTRTAQNEIRRQFQRLPNPDLLMYVFPHLAGTEHVPVPGYTTVFSMHERVEYALPGERVQDY